MNWLFLVPLPSTKPAFPDFLGNFEQLTLWKEATLQSSITFVQIGLIFSPYIKNLDFIAFKVIWGFACSFVYSRAGVFFQDLVIKLPKPVRSPTDTVDIFFKGFVDAAAYNRDKIWSLFGALSGICSRGHPAVLVTSVHRNSPNSKVASCPLISPWYWSLGLSLSCLKHIQQQENRKYQWNWVSIKDLPESPRGDCSFWPKWELSHSWECHSNSFTTFQLKISQISSLWETTATGTWNTAPFITQFAPPEGN